MPIDLDRQLARDMSDYLKLAREAREAIELLTPLQPPNMQAMSDARINPFAVQLMAESWCQHPAAREGSLCLTWRGVEITLGPNKLREVSAALCDAIEAQAVEISALNEDVAATDDARARQWDYLRIAREKQEEQAAEIERLKMAKDNAVANCATLRAHLKEIAGCECSECRNDY